MVFKHTVTGAGLGRTQCGTGWESVKGECVLEVWGCGAGARKISQFLAGANQKFQPAQDLVHSQRKVGNPRLYESGSFSRQTCSEQATPNRQRSYNRSVMNETFMNVVSYERSLFRTGLL